MPRAASDVPVTALAAASILLLRDGPAGSGSLEVLMMERHGAMGFAAGAMVFPGGKISASDSAPALSGRMGEAGAGAAELQPFRLGAMRELFEEAGILLAGDASGQAIDPGRAGELAARHRDQVVRDPAAFAAMLEAGGLYLAPSELVHFAHWITPEAAPRRFDTHFFATRAPAGQEAVSDQQEAVNMAWLRPRDVLDMGGDGRTMLMFPTRLNLKRLAPCGTTDEALAAAREARVVAIMPKPLFEDGEIYLTIPPDAGYGVVKVRRADIPEAAGANFGPSGKPAKSG